MDRRMHLGWVEIIILLQIIATLGFAPGIDGPVTQKLAVEGGNATLYCDTSTHTLNTKFELLVWYKNDISIFSYDARDGYQWASEAFNVSGRLRGDVTASPASLVIGNIVGEDEALYHCRVEFPRAPTRNIGVNLTVIVRPGLPFFQDERNNKVEDKIGPFFEGDILILRCLVIGGRPPPQISWYSGDVLVDNVDDESDVPGIRENVLSVNLSRDYDAPLTCKATNTLLTDPVSSTLDLELYLPANNVAITWSSGASNHSLQSGVSVVAKCTATGSRPEPRISWWLGNRHLTRHSNESWLPESRTAESYLEFTPTPDDNEAALTCIATNDVMDVSQGSKAHVVSLNVTYSPILEVMKADDDKFDKVVETKPLHLICENKANPAVERIKWYFNDIELLDDVGLKNSSLPNLFIENSSRQNAGSYSCGAINAIGETRSQHLTITVLYPPECSNEGITLEQESLQCHIDANPKPDTYFWHISTFTGTQLLTTGSHILPLSQLTGYLSDLRVNCWAGNGVTSQVNHCEKNLNVLHLRPPTPRQCDLDYEVDNFHIRCMPVENATRYEISVWKMSPSNLSLVLDRRGLLGGAMALAHSGEGWLVKGKVGSMNAGDEARIEACNRYGCSLPLELRPSDTLLQAAAYQWYQFFMDKDVGIAIGSVVLVIAFVLSSLLIRKLAMGLRRKTPVIQVLQLDEVTRGYLDSMERKHHSCSMRSCSSGYSGGSMDSVPPVDRHRKPFWDPGPPPDVTLTLHRESAV